MNKISGTFAGTGAALNICIGFIPDRVKIMNLTSAVLASLTYDKKMSGVTAVAGGILGKLVVDSGVTGNATMGKLAASAGVAEYEGGDSFSSAQTAYLTKKVDGTYDFEGAIAGDILPAGFKINETAAVNISGEVCFFEAEADDI
jgi:hypothetical protein